MRTKIAILLILIALMLPLIPLALSARIYSTPFHSGIAWDIGGIEFRGDPGVFLCSGDYNPETGNYRKNPLADLFPELVVDC